MTNHKTGTREEWLAARLELLKAEKELTRRSDELVRRRQELPWVRIEKEYRFETDEGAPHWRTSSKGARSFLFITSCSGPDYTAGCPTCSTIADGFNGFAIHLAHHDVMLLCAVSRAPLEKLQAYKRRMGFRAMDTRSDLGNQQTLAIFGTDAATVTREAPGISAFALEDGVVYHTYSADTRGLDALWGMYQ
jgi:predicted dithiol-disulfide oxidoreductase (DUF899 family)